MSAYFVRLQAAPVREEHSMACIGGTLTAVSSTCVVPVS